jgi:hypothetical protein
VPIRRRISDDHQLRPAENREAINQSGALVRPRRT